MPSLWQINHFVFKTLFIVFFYNKRTKAPVSPEFNESFCCDLNSLMSFKTWIFSLFSYCLDVRREVPTAKLFICLHWSRCFILIGRMLQNPEYNCRICEHSTSFNKFLYERSGVLFLFSQFCLVSLFALFLFLPE